MLVELDEATTVRGSVTQPDPSLMTPSTTVTTEDVEGGYGFWSLEDIWSY